MARRSALVKALVGLAALSLLVVLFLRSAQSSRESPYVIGQASLSPWALVVEPEGDMLGSWLALRPPAGLASVGRQVFARGGETVHYPNPLTLPLILRSEFDRALAGALTAEDALEIARAAGIESATFDPRCLAHRRLSGPGTTRGIYFILFDAPAFGRFRQEVAASLRLAGREASLFDPEALSPVLLVAGLDGFFSNWLPLRAEAELDCLAPVEVQ